MLKKQKKLFSFFIVILVCCFFAVNNTYGADFGLDTAVQQVPDIKAVGTDVPGILGNILGQILALVGIIFFGLMIYGGVLWMLARGNESMSKKALDTIVMAIVGLILVLSSFALTNFIFSSIQENESIPDENANQNQDTQVSQIGYCMSTNFQRIDCATDADCAAHSPLTTCDITVGAQNAFCSNATMSANAIVCNLDSDCTDNIGAGWVCRF